MKETEHECADVSCDVRGTQVYSTPFMNVPIFRMMTVGSGSERILTFWESSIGKEDFFGMAVDWRLGTRVDGNWTPLSAIYYVIKTDVE